jgi:glucose-1-phosphate cytidylyltransferase
MSDLTSGGFFVFDQRVFDYLDDDCVLEQDPLEKLAGDRQLALFAHEGYWQCMDTHKEALALNQVWNTGNAPWKTW